MNFYTNTVNIFKNLKFPKEDADVINLWINSKTTDISLSNHSDSITSCSIM